MEPSKIIRIDSGKEIKVNDRLTGMRSYSLHILLFFFFLRNDTATFLRQDKRKLNGYLYL